MEISVKRIIRLAIEGAIVLTILVVGLWARAEYLDADPPLGLSSSTDVYTDPPQYTMFAKDKVLTGDFNRMDERRFPFFINSSVTALAWLVFSWFGVGLLQSNAVGLFYAFGALLLFFLFLRRYVDPLTGILFLLFAVTSYNLVFYGRLPFLEHAMAFWAFLAMVLLAWFRNWSAAGIAGIALAVAIVFSKMIGLIFVVPVAGFVLYRLSHEKWEPWRRLLYFGPFSLGFLVTMGLWAWLVYLPWQSQAAGYLAEQSMALYGTPEGIQSIDGFFYKLSTFGDAMKLFTRMPLEALLGGIMLVWVAFQVGRYGLGKLDRSPITAGHMFMALMVVSFVGALMIWNYRPLRYALVLIYPLSALAAMAVAKLASGWEQGKKSSIPLTYYPAALLVGMNASYQLLKQIGGNIDFLLNWDDHWFLVVIGALILTAAGFVLILHHRRGNLPYIPWLAVPVAAGLTIFAVWPDVQSYLFWHERPTFTARDNSRDLAAILGDGAVVSGPHGPLLTLENNHQAIIHMFGVSEADTALFAKRPITHLAVDLGNLNRWRADYSAIHDSGYHLLTYHVGRQKVRLFHIANISPNPAASAYVPTPFEVAAVAYQRDSVELGQRAALRFLTNNEENLSGYYLMAEQAKAAGLYEEAIYLLKKAVEFSPTNYVLTAELAELYKERWEQTGDAAMRRAALDHFEQATHLTPGDRGLQAKYFEFREEDEWQPPDTISWSLQ